jgi:hypothetical protein
VNGRGASPFPPVGEIVAVEFGLDLPHDGVFVAARVAGVLRCLNRLPTCFGCKCAAFPLLEGAHEDGLSLVFTVRAFEFVNAGLLVA